MGEVDFEWFLLPLQFFECYFLKSHSKIKKFSYNNNLCEKFRGVAQSG